MAGNLRFGQRCHADFGDRSGLDLTWYPQIFTKEGQHFIDAIVILKRENSGRICENGIERFLEHETVVKCDLSRTKLNGPEMNHGNISVYWPVCPLQ
jgi:hypothetical protein